MPLRLVRSSSSAALWAACVDRFLDQAARSVGPGGHRAHLWLTHRVQRDALFEAAARRGVPGWLAPPVSFFSHLPRLFDVRLRPVGLLRRRMTLATLAAGEGLPGLGRGDRLEARGIAHALDALFGELVSEGVTAERLRDALARLDGDEFARRRDGWVASVYAAYLARLDEAGRYDRRAIHAIVADRVAESKLLDALGGARELHIYGITSLRTRRRLVEALRDQPDVDVSLYLLLEDEPGEWDELGAEAETIPAERGGPPRVVPAPDARREMEWIAGEVKRLVQEGGAEPHEIAVVARTGREDTRRAHEVFGHAGIPATARVRSALAEVPAVKAVLVLFRGAARNWPYRSLRDVLTSAYWSLDVDLRSIDFIAAERRVQGLEAWEGQLELLLRQAEQPDDDPDEEGAGGERQGGRDAASEPPSGSGFASPVERLGRQGVRVGRLRRDLVGLRELRHAVAHLSDARPAQEWIEETIRLLDPGVLGFRQNLCDDAGGHHEIARLDQRGVEAVKRLLAEWREVELAGQPGPALPVEEWYPRLRRFLESNEIALSTPLQKGVQILEAHEAALFPFRHVFVAHANDGEFPRAATGGTILTDEERRALAAQGLPLSHRELSLRRERTLWRAVTAGPAVTLTYRTADANGNPLLPSLLVPPHDEGAGIPRTRFAWPEPMSEVHANQTAAAALARLERERAQGRREDGGSGGDGGGEPARVGAPDALALRKAVVAAHAEAWRRGDPVAGREPGTAGPWCGLVRDPWVLARLAERFPDDRAWSASQLELYGSCPFHFLLERVLRLEEREEADEATTPLTFGGVAHRILERFYRALGERVPPELAGDALELYEEIAGAVLAEAEADAGAGRGWLGIPAVWKVTRQEILERVRAYLVWELRKIASSGERPHELEYAFGGEADDPAWVRGRDLAGARRELRVRGRMDRIDVSDGPEGPVFHVLDYKSGRPPRSAGYRDGGVLQIPLYMSALRELRRLAVGRGRYRSIKHTSEGSAVEFGSDEFNRAIAIALSIPARIRRGLFEPQAGGSTGWPEYRPGLDVARVQYVLKDRSRFDG